MVGVDVWIKAVLDGEYDARGLPVPALDPAEHASIVRRIYRDYGIPHTVDPVEALELEEFTLCRVFGAPRCGMETDKRIFLPYQQDRRLESLLCQHARSHGWCKRLRLWDVNESDIWNITLKLIVPPWVRTDPSAYTCHQHAPTWVLDGIYRQNVILTGT